MVLPESNGFIRTGLPHIASSEKEIANNKSQLVEIRKASDFISQIPHIDYIKCDIEGYEAIVFDEFKSYLMKVRPLIQIEIGQENVAKMLELFTELDYLQYGIANFLLSRKKEMEHNKNRWFLFIPADKKAYFESLIKWK